MTHIHQELIDTDQREAKKTKEKQKGAKQMSKTGGQMLNEREQKAKAEETSKMQGLLRARWGEELVGRQVEIGKGEEDWS